MNEDQFATYLPAPPPTPPPPLAPRFTCTPGDSGICISSTNGTLSEAACIARCRSASAGSGPSSAALILIGVVIPVLGRALGQQLGMMLCSSALGGNPMKAALLSGVSGGAADTISAADLMFGEDDCSWTDAVHAMGWAPRMGVAVSAIRLVLWHWMQPAVYSMALLAYWSDIGAAQQQLCLVVATREALYFALTLVALAYRPVFLLANLSSLRNRTFSWLVYVAAPEKYVALCCVDALGLCTTQLLLALLTACDVCGTLALAVAARDGELHTALAVGYTVATVGWVAFMIGALQQSYASCIGQDKVQRVSSSMEPGELPVLVTDRCDAPNAPHCGMQVVVLLAAPGEGADAKGRLPAAAVGTVAAWDEQRCRAVMQWPTNSVGQRAEPSSHTLAPHNCIGRCAQPLGTGVEGSWAMYVGPAVDGGKTLVAVVGLDERRARDGSLSHLYRCSHLGLPGADVWLTREQMASPGFWPQAADHAIAEYRGRGRRGDRARMATCETTCESAAASHSSGEIVGACSSSVAVRAYDSATSECSV